MSDCEMTGIPILNLWTCFKQRKTHLANSFSAPRDSQSCCMLKERWRKLWHVSSLTHLVPRVYAAEAEKMDSAEAVSQMVVTKPRVIITDKEVQDFLNNETGKDRLRKMFSINPDGSFSADLLPVTNSVSTTLCLMFLIGGVMGAVEAKHKFIQDHKHTKFSTHIMARRRHTDALFLGLFKGGVSWAMKTGTFVFMFMMTAQTVSVYRNKTTPLEYVGAGTLTCAILRAHLGPRAMFAAGVIGSGLGLIGGLASYGLMRIGNITQEEKHYWEVYEMLKDEKSAKLLQEDALGAAEKHNDTNTS